jgi:phosphopantothenoylcysteine decarboxylase/phosphopantothenate--cysteine ligase
MNKKNIIIGVTGGIAAYKALDIVSYFRKQDYNVHVIMTKNATEFVAPLTFETLSNNKVSIDTFDRKSEYNVEHVSLANQADICCIVPATANFIAKAANGIADDMLTTTFLACHCPKIICPAMNTNMYNNPITIANIKKCQDYGMLFVDSASGILACGDIGKGRLAPTDTIIDMIKYELYPDTLKGKRVLVSAGGTQESLDPVRIITNHSTGKMGFAIAKMARSLKADVTIVAANTNIPISYDINKINVTSAQDMYEIITDIYKDFDYIIMASAVSDFTPSNYVDEKIKKNDDKLIISLKKTKDILKFIGQNHNSKQIICGFAMESSNLIENATKKLTNKNIDMIVANDIKDPQAGFSKDTNVATIITNNYKKQLEVMSKEDLGLIILTKMKEIDDAANN